MHTATQLNPSQFAIEIAGEPADFDDLVPEWRPDDRFGIVVHEPFGAIGASLLLQRVITAFYDAVPARRTSLASYAEIYAFHVGGRYGDLSPFDFWPPRKEVFVDADPVAVIGAINAVGITRLAVPDGPLVPVDYAGLVSAGWSERHSAIERIRSVYVYSPAGRVEGSDISVRGLDPTTEVNAVYALNPQASLDDLGNLTPEQYDAYWEGAEFDNRGWLEQVAKRMDEQPAAVRNAVAAQRQSLLRDGVAVETYRRISVEEALGRLVPVSQPAASR